MVRQLSSCVTDVGTLSDPIPGALIATRLLIGAFEAGFYPTAVAYLSFFYPRYDFCVRLALFYGQYAIAGAFSGSICRFRTQLSRNKY